MFKDHIIGRADNPFLILAADLDSRLTPEDRETLRAVAAQAMLDAPTSPTRRKPWIEFEHELYRFRAKRNRNDLEVELIDQPTLTEALKDRGLVHRRDPLTDHDGRHEIRAAAGSLLGRYTPTEAWAKILFQEARPHPTFDASKVTIERHRPSVTQGEVTVTYDGQVINRYGDSIVLLPLGGTVPEGAELLDGWHGHGDAYWIEVARRIIARGIW
ncbi:hypothetical protein [Microvirga tunisiensis]|uniref:Uncharacterized protein n=1 Tax=Microvirga tunisiensis TaxID=2108360 RepID=A0A5N7MWT7_9HYPH|nr:hypothetical protein [Microvirga tunisiensis]MPR11132.1 hypothetical protein [Microvirga tunisiensis]MPR28526.1 hypothetical protein [Microvirga tunisiensis]